MRCCLEDSARYIPDLSLPPRQTGLWDQSGLSLGYPMLLSGAALDVAFPRLQQEATVNYIHYIISYYLLYSDSTYNCFTAFKMLFYSSVPQFSANTPAHCDSVEQRNLFIDLHL